MSGLCFCSTQTNKQSIQTALSSSCAARAERPHRQRLSTCRPRNNGAQERRTLFWPQVQHQAMRYHPGRVPQRQGESIAAVSTSFNRHAPGVVGARASTRRTLLAWPPAAAATDAARNPPSSCCSPTQRRCARGTLRTQSALQLRPAQAKFYSHASEAAPRDQT